MSLLNITFEISLLDILSGKIAEAEGHVVAFEEALAKTTGLINDLAEAVGKLREASGGNDKAETTRARVSPGTSQDADRGKQSSGGVNTLVAELTLLKKAIDDVKGSIGNLVTGEKADFISATKELSNYVSALNGLLNDNKAAFVADGKAVANDIVALREHAKVSAAIVETASGWEKLKKVIENVKTILDGYKDVKGLTELFSAAKNAGKTGITPAESAVAGGTVATFAKGALAKAAIAAVIADIGLQFMPSDKISGDRVDLIDYLADMAMVLPGSGKARRIGARNEEADALEHSFQRLAVGYSGSDYIQNGTIHMATLDPNGSDLVDVLSKSSFFDEIDNFDDYGERLYKTNAELLPVLKQTWKDLPFVLAKDNMTSGSGVSDQIDGDINPYFPNLPPQKQTDTKTSRQLQRNQLNVHGQDAKKINLIINGGLIHTFTVNTTSVKESVQDIKRLVEGAIMDALKDAEIQN